ncbi:MAG: Na/Pi cotransporter family protein [Clostridia bacterium]|nr:Na/Pi cotransporter family protein [Clostridia bacterium]
MDVFNVLTLIGGLCLFLFGMNTMGEGLEKSAGNGLKALLGKLTTGKFVGFLTGLGVTAVIQSSSATTVMVVGFVNSRLMTLRQAINVIMGANVGTTVTAWILSLAGIEGDNFFMKLLKPTSFSPVLALIGIILVMGSKNSKKKDVGGILLGFATLMFGMDTMSGAVSGLSELEGFRNLMLMFSNPILGVLVGAVMTAIIQSSSASVGVLQALSATGQITVGASIPIIMGQNIGTCVTALLSSVGANRNARRASVVHLCFNIIGTGILLAVFSIVRAVVSVPLFDSAASAWSIALVHSIFNVACTVLMFPATGLLEKLSVKLIPEPKGDATEAKIELDERLMNTPALAISRCHDLTVKMATVSEEALRKSMFALQDYSPELAERVRVLEGKADRYEDILGSYLVKLNTYPMSAADSHESAKLLHLIGDFERISDHAVNLLESAEEIKEKGIAFSDPAQRELKVLMAATEEIVFYTMKAFLDGDLAAASQVEPLEQVVDDLKDQLRLRHIQRLQKGECSIEVGFVWADLLTNFERVSDHCSNIAGCMIEMAHDAMDMHEYLNNIKHNNPVYQEKYKQYSEKYALPCA